MTQPGDCPCPRLADGLVLKHMLVFAALIVATDPIAVVAPFWGSGGPKRVTVLIDAESLLNDGTAVVFFPLILGQVSSGPVSLGGAVVGLRTMARILLIFLASTIARY